MRNDYTYDKNHRVILQDNTIFNPERQDDWYTASFTYDAAGNILTLKRNGMFGPQPGQQTYVPIDDLLYEYDLNTPGVKQLKSIDDLLQGDPQPLGFKPDILYYGYDGNGNMLSSQHGTVTWNVINMPLTATIPGGEIKFDYTFSGEKTRMQISGSEAEDRLYLGGAEFVFDQSAGIYLTDNYQHEEGRRQYRQDDYEQDPKPHAMQYQITDHLGNLAVLFSDANDDGHVTSENETSDPDEIEVLQRQFYYPFGMDMDGTWLRVKPYEDRYRYNHKELTKGLGWYAYGARYYDAAVGRFAGVDPIADIAPDWTPYRYGFDNPILYTDPFGLFETKREARRYRRKNTDLSWWNSSIKKNKDGTFDIRDDNSHMAITKNGDGEIEYSATAMAYGFRQREAGFWERRKEGGFFSRLLYGMANGVNVLGRQTFYGRGEQIPTLDGFSVTKGSNEAIDAGLDGLLTLAPLPLPKGYSAAAKNGTGLVDDVAKQMQLWLGKNYKTITNKAGDNIFMSKDGLRKIRFDIKNPHGDKPHIHLEVFENGKWKDALPGALLHKSPGHSYR
jgi:RHS repeat-associated protein